MLFPLYEERLAGRKTLTYLNEFEDNLQKTTAELEQQQLLKLKALLLHAYASCDYYRKEWDRLSFRPQELTSVDDLQKLPLITKDIIKENYNGFVSSSYQGKNIRKATGGSSGVPFQFELDRQSNERRQAVMWRGYGGLGAGLGARALYVWGSNIRPVGSKNALKETLYHAFYHRKMLNSFDMCEDNIGEYVEAINRYRPEVIVAYVNPMVMLADHIVSNKLKVHAPKSILTGAEPLYEFQRERIEEAFSAPVYNTYGCREFMLIGAECEQRSGLHLNIDQLLVELVNSEGAIAEETGDLAITDLHNYGFPLIRYVNGDRGTRSEQQACSCGSPLPLLRSVDGRKLDVIRTRSGKVLPGEFFPHLLKDFSAIKQFQVEQQELDAVIIRLVLNKEVEWQAQLGEIQGLVSGYLDKDTTVVIECVDTIELTASGKLRVTISNLT